MATENNLDTYLKAEYCRRWLKKHHFLTRFQNFKLFLRILKYKRKNHIKDEQCDFNAVEFVYGNLSGNQVNMKKYLLKADYCRKWLQENHFINDNLKIEIQIKTYKYQNHNNIQLSKKEFENVGFSKK